MLFLGSPSIRVDGREVEPGADLRRDYSRCCRLSITAAGRALLPDERWMRADGLSLTGYNVCRRSVGSRKRPRADSTAQVTAPEVSGATWAFTYAAYVLTGLT